MLTAFQTLSSVGDLYRLAHLKATFTDEETEAHDHLGSQWWSSHLYPGSLALNLPLQELLFC